jgi:hypothetical protein
VEEPPEDYADMIVERLKEAAGFIGYGIRTQAPAANLILDCNEAIHTLQAVIEWAQRQEGTSDAE